MSIRVKHEVVRKLEELPESTVLLKVPQEITPAAWPRLARHGALAGRPNPSFLDAALFRERLADVLEPHREKVGVLMFEFGEFPQSAYPNGVHAFVADLRSVSRPTSSWPSVRRRDPQRVVP